MTLRTIKLHGKYWFELRYAATLLHTSRGVLETLVIRKKLKSKEIEGTVYLAEAQITELRRDPAAWKSLKETAKLARAPKRSAPMPASTVYMGDAPSERLKIPPRIGHPLKDQG